MKKSIWFVINPISGVRRKDDLPELIHEPLDHTQFDYLIKSTSHKGHAIDIAKNATSWKSVLTTNNIKKVANFAMDSFTETFATFKDA